MIALLKRRPGIFPTLLGNLSKSVRYQTWLALARVSHNGTTETNILNAAKEENQYFNFEKIPDTYIFAHHRYERWSAELCWVALKKALPLPTIAGDRDDDGDGG